MSEQVQLSEEDQFDAIAKGLAPEQVKEGEVEAEAEPVEQAEEADAENVNAPVEEAEPFPGFNSLSEEHRNAITAQIEAERLKAQELDQRYRQQHGQLAPAQRKLSELEKQNNNLLKLVSELQQTKLTDAQTHGKTAFEKYKEQYPEEAAAHEARYTPLELQNKQLADELRATRESIQTVQQEIALQKNSAALIKIHPDAYEIVTDPVFNAWVGALDEEDQARVNSDDPRIASKILDQFKRDKFLYELQQERELLKTQTPPSRGKPKLDVDPTSRNRQSPAPVRQGNASGSEEEQWAAWNEARNSA